MTEREDLEHVSNPALRMLATAAEQAFDREQLLWLSRQLSDAAARKAADAEILDDVGFRRSRGADR